MTSAPITGILVIGKPFSIHCFCSLNWVWQAQLQVSDRHVFFIIKKEIFPETRMLNIHRNFLK